MRANRQVVPISAIAVSASDRRVTLTLSTTIKQDQVVRVSYADPTDGDDAAALRSPAGVDARSFRNFRVSNGSTVPHPDNRGPVVQSARWTSNIRSTIVLTFTHRIDRTRLPPVSWFTLTLAGTRIGDDGVRGGDTDRQLFIDVENALFGDALTVTVAYNDPNDAT